MMSYYAWLLNYEVKLFDYITLPQVNFQDLYHYANYIITMLCIFARHTFIEVYNYLVIGRIQFMVMASHILFK